MRFSKCFLICCVLLVAPAQAQDDDKFPTPDVVGCLKAVEPLDLRYRGWMQRQCIVSAGVICGAPAEADGTCQSELTASLRAYYDELLPLMPPKIEGAGIRAKGYERALEQAADLLENLSECDGLSRSEFAICEYITLSVTVIDLLRQAGVANVSVP